MADRPELLHPLALSTPGVWWRLRTRHAPLSPESLAARVVIAGGVIGLTGLRLLEKFRLRRMPEPTAPPVFIVGHWRSGTTHLHNLLHRSGEFATLSHAAAAGPWIPPSSIAGLIDRFTPETREFDNVRLASSEPQEEELALACMGPVSVFHAAFFPRETEAIMRQALDVGSLDPKDRADFTRNYRHLHARTAFDDGGQRQVLFKNPSSTTRLDFLMEIFPGAKFIHIVRDPVAVHHSTLRMFTHMNREFSLQGNPHDTNDHSDLIALYRSIMSAHLEQRKRVPAGDYHELRYEDLVADPLREIERLHETFGWEFTPSSRHSIGAYVHALSGYKKNKHPDDPAIAARLRDECAFAFETWGY